MLASGGMVDEVAREVGEQFRHPHAGLSLLARLCPRLREGVAPAMRPGRPLDRGQQVLKVFFTLFSRCQLSRGAKAA